MAKYLVDANLPYYFNLWNNDDFVHVNDLDFLQTDSQIWDYSKEKDLILLSKDADFTIRLLTFGPPPEVVPFKFGNLRIKEFHGFITKNWGIILSSIAENNLVNVFIDRIEAVK
jgi:predicted nuclease of predicted toxin-antitoxin system